MAPTMRTPSSASTTSTNRTSTSSSSSSFLASSSTKSSSSVIADELMSPQTYSRSLLTGVQQKFSTIAAFNDTASEYGVNHLLDTLQRELGKVFQMGEDIHSGAFSREVKYDMLQSLIQEQAQTFCKDSASVVDFFGDLVNQSPDHWHRSITITLMFEDRAIRRMRESSRIFNSRECAIGKKTPGSDCVAVKLFAKSAEKEMVISIVKGLLRKNPLMFVMGEAYATAAILGSNLLLPTLSVLEKVK